MLYLLNDLKHAMTTPLRLQAKMMRMALNPLNPLSETSAGRTIAASAEMIERMTKNFERPSFNLTHTTIDNKKIEISEKIIATKPFARLLHFHRHIRRDDPKILIVAPMSGHWSTLLRGTVEAMLPHHNVFITDWEDARQVPLNEGEFSLNTYISYIRDFLNLMGPDTHVIAVCQPTVPVFAAISLMASDKDPNQPLSMTLMGGPIDTRISKTEVTELAESRPLSWFENNVLQDVPFYYPGAFRKVYPGFLQLGGFMSMNLDRHVGSHLEFYNHLIQGDGESAEKHRKFYDEYLSVMDISAEFYLQTVKVVFQNHDLPRGQMQWTDPLSKEDKYVRPGDIKKTALLTIEGELDDISARGQTTAAHELCHSLAQHKQYHHFQLKTGHYGIFNGSKFRTQIMPRIRHFIRKFDLDKDPIPKIDLKTTPDIAPEKYSRDKHGIAAIRRWIRDNQAENFKEVVD